MRRRTTGLFGKKDVRLAWVKVEEALKEGCGTTVYEALQGVRGGGRKRKDVLVRLLERSSGDAEALGIVRRFTAQQVQDRIKNEGRRCGT